jgi:hypothetical protein
MRRSRPLVAAVAVLAAAGLSGCASGLSQQPASADESTTAPTPTATAASGVRSAAGDLLQFRCTPTADPAVWTAKGVIVNSAAKADYRVTVLVASPGATTATARRLVVPKVETGVETAFSVDRLAANPGSAPVCRVQLVRLG